MQKLTDEFQNLITEIITRIETEGEIFLLELPASGLCDRLEELRQRIGWDGPAFVMFEQSDDQVPEHSIVPPEYAVELCFVTAEPNSPQTQHQQIVAYAEPPFESPDGGLNFMWVPVEGAEQQAILSLRRWQRFAQDVF
jgi:hypothetical protein